MRKQGNSKRLTTVEKTENGVINAAGALDYSKGWAYVNLRIPLEILQELDDHLLLRRSKSPRMFWIIGAILERMEREKEEHS